MFIGIGIGVSVPQANPGSGETPIEFIQNPTFSPSDGWAAGATWSFVGASAVNSGTYSDLTATLMFPLVPGESYQLIVEWTGFGDGCSAALSGKSPQGLGGFTGIPSGTPNVFIATSANTQLRLFNADDGAGVITRVSLLAV